MSFHEYAVAARLFREDVPFYALIMAAMSKSTCGRPTADPDNAYKLRTMFPDVWDELHERDRTPGGRLKNE